MAVDTFVRVAVASVVVVVGLSGEQGTKPQGATTGRGPAAPTSSWVRSISRSQMDDSKTVIYQVPATGQITGWLAKARPVLLARCKEGEIDVYITLGMPVHVESGDSRTVRVRFDDETAETQFWGQSTDGHALFSPDAIEFAQALAAARRLRVEVTPFNATPVIMKLTVSGFPKPLKELEATCPGPPQIAMPKGPPVERFDHATSPDKDVDVFAHDDGTIYHKERHCASLAGKTNVRAVKLGSLSKDYDPCHMCKPPK